MRLQLEKRAELVREPLIVKELLLLPPSALLGDGRASRHETGGGEARAGAGCSRAAG